MHICSSDCVLLHVYKDISEQAVHTKRRNFADVTPSQGHRDMYVCIPRISSANLETYFYSFRTAHSPSAIIAAKLLFSF